MNRIWLLGLCLPIFYFLSIGPVAVISKRLPPRMGEPIITWLYVIPLQSAPKPVLDALDNYAMFWLEITNTPWD